MQQQPESISSSLPASPAPQPGRTDGPAPALEVALDPASQRIPRWLESSELFLRVVLRMYIGLVIFYLPWSGQIATSFPEVLNYLPWSRVLWDQNPLFMQIPTLGIYAANGAVRGIVSGLGLLNIWIAFQDAVRRRDG
jgi:hypothetical protein